jgi:hypothetical protein
MHYAPPESGATADEAFRVNVFFKGIMIEDPNRERSRPMDRIVSDRIAIPNWQGRESLWAVDAHILGCETSQYVAISRDRFLSGKVREIVRTMQGITLWAMEKIVRLIHTPSNKAADLQNPPSLACFRHRFEVAETCVKELLSVAHFLLPTERTEREKLLLQLDSADGRAYRFTHTAKEPLLDMPTALNPWCVNRIDYIVGSIQDTEDCSIPQEHALLAVCDLWGQYHDLVAMDALHLYRPKRPDPEYQIIYHLSLRDSIRHTPLAIQDAYYWRYARQLLKKERASTPIRILLPGHPDYPVITVDEVREELYAKENGQFPNWIILPVSTKDAQNLLTKAEEKQQEMEKELDCLLSPAHNHELYQWVLQHSTQSNNERMRNGSPTMKVGIIAGWYKAYMLRLLQGDLPDSSDQT